MGERARSYEIRHEGSAEQVGARQITSKLTNQLISMVAVGVCSWLVGVCKLKEQEHDSTGVG